MFTSFCRLPLWDIHLNSQYITYPLKRKLAPLTLSFVPAILPSFYIQSPQFIDINMPIPLASIKAHLSSLLPYTETYELPCLSCKAVTVAESILFPSLVARFHIIPPNLAKSKSNYYGMLFLPTF